MLELFMFFGSGKKTTENNFLKKITCFYFKHYAGKNVLGGKECAELDCSAHDLRFWHSLN